LLTLREARLLQRIIHRDTLQLDLQEREGLRARLLRAALTEVLKVRDPGESS
jgi:transcriptional regulator CtsR